MKDTVRKSPRTRVLLELRPAFDGFAGIPQETRLLFRGLRMLQSCEVAGLLQMSGRILAKGVRASAVNLRSRTILAGAARHTASGFRTDSHRSRIYQSADRHGGVARVARTSRTLRHS